MNMLMQLRGRLIARLPLIFVLILIFANVLFGIVSVLPGWLAYEDLSTQIVARQTEQAALTTERNADEDLRVYEMQIARAEEELVTAAAVFLSAERVDSLLDAFYAYAGQHNVLITNLQTQQTAQTTEALPYETRVFRLQVTGAVTQLMAFVVQIREATIPGVMIDTLNLSQTDTNSAQTGILTMEVRAMLSPLAAGVMVQEPAPLASLPPIAQNTPSEATVQSETQAVALLPTATPPIPQTPQDEAIAKVSTDMPVEQPVTSDQALTETTPPAPLSPVIECPGAPDVQFQIGDWVVVDFDETGALRLMDRVDGGAPYTPVQVYDNEVLRILAGPVCGHWNQASIWYWYVDHEGTMGWVGEGTAEDRWLCPIQNPECGG